MKVDCRHCYKILLTNKTKRITTSLYAYMIIKKISRSFRRLINNTKQI